MPSEDVELLEFFGQTERVQDLEAMYKDSKYPSHRVIRELKNHDDGLVDDSRT